MFSTLEVEVRPGSGLGMFEIGVFSWYFIPRAASNNYQGPLCGMCLNSSAVCSISSLRSM